MVTEKDALFGTRYDWYWYSWSAPTVREQTQLSKEDAADLIEKVRRAYPGLDSFLSSTATPDSVELSPECSERLRKQEENTPS